MFNTHATPPRYAEWFGRQLDHLLARYEPLDPYRLEQTLEVGASGRRPAAVFTFDDGFRNHFEVAAAELEKRGARGIFSIPAAFPSVPVAEQVEWCRSRDSLGSRRRGAFAPGGSLCDELGSGP